MTVLWPTVAVVICSYNRPEEFRSTFYALLENLKYPNLHWHIADDGTSSPVLGEMIGLVRSRVGGEGVSMSITNRKGWGANVNSGLDTVFGDKGYNYVYFSEDDYVLKRELDLRPYVAVLSRYPEVGMARFGISGHVGMAATLREYYIADVVPDYNEVAGSGSSGPGVVNAWELSLPNRDNWGPFGFYRYSNRPHLKHKRFHDFYGKYVEGQTLAATEDEFNRRIGERAVGLNSGPPAIIVPAKWTYWWYDHIGKSRQGTAEDVHNG